MSYFPKHRSQKKVAMYVKKYEKGIFHLKPFHFYLKRNKFPQTIYMNNLKLYLCNLERSDFGAPKWSQ